MSATYLGSWEAGSPEWHGERQASVGGSDIAVLMGKSPYNSAFSLYHERKALVPREPENRQMSWGKRLEPVIAQAYAERIVGNSGVEFSYQPGAVYAHSERRWQVCSPDALILNDASGVDRVIGGLEVKNIRTAEEWGAESTEDIPPVYYCQVQWCADVFGLPSWDVAVLIGGSDFRVYTIRANAEYQAQMRATAQDFLHQLEHNIRPDIDTHDRTYEAVRQLHLEIDRDRDVEIDRDLAATYCEAKAAAEKAKAEFTRASSLLADAIGNAQRATFLEQTIARRQAKGTGVPYLVAGRNLPTFREDAA